MKFNLDPIYVEDRPNEVKHAYCSSEKARRMLNYKTQISLDMSLEKIIDFIIKKGPKKFEYNYKLEIINEKTPNTWKKKFF
jgi:UDP-glucose 4-epimerase